jgi:hypothetical protein
MNSQRGACHDVLADARRTIEVEPSGWAAYDLLARALAAEAAPRAAIEQALEQKWASLPEAERGTKELFDRLDLALLEGDFAGAERHALQLMRAMRTVPSERPHGELVRRLFEIYEETGRRDLASATAADFLMRRRAWSGAMGDNPDDVLMSPVAQAIAITVRAQITSPDEGEKARDEWIEQWLSRLPAAYKGRVWFPAYALPTRTAREARAALEARARFGPSEAFDRAWADVVAANVHLTAGDAITARSLLERATTACVALDVPVSYVRAFLMLGEARERTGDARGACTAYAQVIHRWRNARPRSETLDVAAARVRALSCPTSEYARGEAASGTKKVD